MGNEKQQQKRLSTDDGEKKKRSLSPSEEKQRNSSVEDAEKKRKRSPSEDVDKKKKRRQSSPGKERKESSVSKKASICESINKLARLDDVPKLVKTKDLIVDKLYQVNSFKVVISEFGRSVMVFLDESFWIFLPKRLSIRLLKNEEELEVLEKAAADGILSLRYLDGRYNTCEFTTDEDSSTSDSN